MRKVHLSDCVGGHESPPSAYRELLLPEPNELAEWAIRMCDRTYQAVLPVRFATAPSTEADWDANAQGGTLLRTLASSARANGEHRYDRLVIIKSDDHDLISPLIQAISSRLPRILNENRLFIARASSTMDYTRRVTPSPEQSRAFRDLLGRCTPYSAHASLHAMSEEQRADTIPELIKALNCTDASVRYLAARELGEIGATATAAVPALKSALNDSQSEVCEMAQQALKLITE